MLLPAPPGLRRTGITLRVAGSGLAQPAVSFSGRSGDLNREVRDLSVGTF